MPLPPTILPGIAAPLGKASNAFSPTRVANLAFWHDPTNAASITLNGGDVSQINDISSNARNAVQGTSSNQPALTSAAINGKNAITYTAANNDSLNLASALDVCQNVAGFTFFAVLNVASIAIANRVFSILTSAGLSRFVLNTTITTGKMSISTRRLDTDTAVTSSATALILTAGTSYFCLWRVNYATGSVKLQLGNSAEVFSAVWASGNGSTDNTPSSGAPNYARSGAAVYGGIIGDAAAYARAITDAEIEQLRAYCAAKWGTS